MTITLRRKQTNINKINIRKHRKIDKSEEKKTSKLTNVSNIANRIAKKMIMIIYSPSN